MNRRSKQRGTTLVELMACLVFLSVAVYPMLACITGSQARSLNAQDRFIALGLAEDELESQHSTGLLLALTPGTTTRTVTPTSMTTPVTIATTVAAVSGYSNLYQVSTTVTWGTTVLPWRNGSISLSTYIEAPHA